MASRSTVFSLAVAMSLSFITPLQANPGSPGGPRGDEGMGRSIRTEASIQYLRSRYGEDPSRWPCDQKMDVGMPIDQIRAGQPPADSQEARGIRRMRDRAN